MVHHFNLMKRKNFFCSLFFLILFAGFGFFSTSALAQDHDILEKFPPEEKAIFAFFRAANTPPDYDFWIKSSWQYENRKPSEQQKYLINEMLRLGQGFAEYDNTKHVIVLYIDAMTKYHKAEDGKSARISFRLNGVRGNEIPTFDFPFGDGFVSLIIRNLDAFRDLPLSEKKAEAISKLIPYDDDEFNTTMEVHVQVKNAEYGEPIKVNGRFKWLMGGEVAYIRCDANDFFSGRNEMLWDYVASWYQEQYTLLTSPKQEQYPHPYDLFKD